MGNILYEKLQHEYVISFNPQTYLAIVLTIVDIFLTRIQLSVKSAQPESRINVGNDMNSLYTQSLCQESKAPNRRKEESHDESDEEDIGMDVELNSGNSASQRDDSSLSDISLDNLTIKHDLGPKTLEAFARNNKNIGFPHQQQQNTFKTSPQANHSNLFRQPQGNIFQSPTPHSQQPQQRNSPNIFQQGSPSVTNTPLLRNLFEKQQNQQNRQFSPTIPDNDQNSRRQPNHFWS